MLNLCIVGASSNLDPRIEFLTEYGNREKSNSHKYTHTKIEQSSSFMSTARLFTGPKLMENGKELVSSLSISHYLIIIS